MLQQLVIAHGDHLLRTIRHLSQKLNLSLDDKAVEQTAFKKRELHPVANSRRKLTPAKYEAWKMWHEDGLSIQKISVGILELFNIDYNFGLECSCALTFYF